MSYFLFCLFVSYLFYLNSFVRLFCCFVYGVRTLFLSSHSVDSTLKLSFYHAQVLLGGRVFDNLARFARCRRFVYALVRAASASGLEHLDEHAESPLPGRLLEAPPPRPAARPTGRDLLRRSRLSSCEHVSGKCHGVCANFVAQCLLHSCSSPAARPPMEGS